MTTSSPSESTTEPSGGDRDPLSLAEGYVTATRLEDRDPTTYRRALAGLDPDRLATALADDAATLAFWLNVYNASVQDHLTRDPSLFERPRLLPIRAIFRRDLVEIAGQSLNLDDVEHGILRRSQQPWGLGYVPRFRPGEFERRHRVDVLDPRIHFALNCGACSCPPVLAYTAADVDAQLDSATRSYLATAVEYDEGSGVARVPRLFSWYRGDFGGKPGIRAFLSDHDVIPEDVTPSLAWKPYDWSLELGRFADDVRGGES